MHTPNAKFLTPLAIVSAALLAVSGGLASAAGTPAGGEIHLYEADTATAGSVGTAILTGAITDYGTDNQGIAGGGTINELDLQKGSFRVDVGKLSNKLNFPVDSQTCSSAGSATAPVPIVKGSGTGAYIGISGTFVTRVTVAGIQPRLGDGDADDACDLSASNGPGVLFGSGSGTLAFK